ncbi:VWA domain-containing protein [Streptomyces sp. BI20]|uniref:VWA domain-containing protein n=1 Tax=Streptomyces sp. BI20 TaxID=3403460 RepID=UPI003C736798
MNEDRDDDRAGVGAGAGGGARVSEGERARRWRLVLGGGDADGTGHVPAGRDAVVDAALARLYDAPDGDPAGPGGSGGGPGGGARAGGTGLSAPSVARWLGDVRSCFPTPVVRILQRDAIDRLGLRDLLLEPETLAVVEPDVHLVGTLLALRDVLPDTTRATARELVRRVVTDLERRLAPATRAALTGARDRSARTRRPRPADVDWDRTIRANLRHWRPEHATLVPERLVGHARAGRGPRKEVVLCVDQSASMAASAVYAAVFGAVLASLRWLDTRLVVFDTEVADLTESIEDPVDVLFGTRLGGGTDIGRALAYCAARITRPPDTVLVLVSDLHDGGARDAARRRVAELTAAGVRVIVLPALSDEGEPAWDREHAEALAAAGATVFACTPDAFPEVMAAALEGAAVPTPAT